MSKIIYKQEIEVRLGEFIDYYNMNIVLTQELIDNNPDLFEVKKDIPEYVECIGPRDDFTLGNIYKFPKPIDDTGYERKNITNWENWTLEFKPSTKKAYDKQELLKEAKKRYPIGTRFKSTEGSTKIYTAKSEPYYSAFLFNSDIIFIDSMSVYSCGRWAEIMILLFTTEDGVDIYRGDVGTYWIIKKNYSLHKSDIPSDYSPNSAVLKRFSSGSKAQEYVDKHKEKTLEDYEKLLLECPTFFNISTWDDIASKDFYMLLKQNEPRLYWTKILQIIADDLNNGWKQTNGYEETSIIMQDCTTSYVTKTAINDIVFKTEGLAQKAIPIITKENLNKINLNK